MVRSAFAIAALYFFLHTPIRAEVFSGLDSAWSADDRNLEAVYLALHALDWRQTRVIAKNPDQFHERNGLLGRHPSTAEVDRFFVVTGLLHYGLARSLAPEWRTGFQQVTLTLKIGVVGNNFRLGINAGF